MKHNAIVNYVALRGIAAVGIAMSLATVHNLIPFYCDGCDEIEFYCDNCGENLIDLLDNEHQI
jgi:hypothetical protein